MNDKDYIRKAVELANGWSWNKDDLGLPYVLGPDQLNVTLIPSSPRAVWLDALAAQLVRQVDHALCSLDWGQLSKPFYKENGTDRAMNTIKAIVDSGVLVESGQE